METGEGIGECYNYKFAFGEDTGDLYEKPNLADFNYNYNKLKSYVAALEAKSDLLHRMLKDLLNHASNLDEICKNSYNINRWVKAGNLKSSDI